MPARRTLRAPDLNPKFRSLCTGRDEEKSNEHAERAKYHSMMASFYQLDEKEQLLIMCAFDALGGESNE